MKRRFALLLLVASPSVAEVTPRPGYGDPHIQQVAYDAEQVVVLNASPGFVTTVELSPDERVENIALGNSGAWQVQVNHRGDRLFVKAVANDVATNLTVFTDGRRYNFILRPNSGEQIAMPFVVRFVYPSQQFAPQPAAPEPVTLFKLRGDRSLWPAAMSDDGNFTSIMWDADQTMPAIYRVDARGAETLVNGVVRDGAFVIEGISTKFIFRLGKNQAIATRKTTKARR